jgi:hypothetical protein
LDYVQISKTLNNFFQQMKRTAAQTLHTAHQTRRRATTGDDERRKKKTAEEREKLRFRRSSSSLIALSVCKSNATQPREQQRNRHGERYLRSRNAFNKVVVK